MTRIAVLGAVLTACSTGSPEQVTARKTEALRAGFVPAVQERAARGAPAIAVDPRGRVFVLDAVNGRIVRKDGDELVPVAEVPGDADDLAIGPDGAMAVRRSVKPEVLVLDPSGKQVGRVDTSALPDVDAISLGRSRRVAVTTPFQETFSLGSPSMPQLPAVVLATKREGAVVLADGRGVVAVHTDDGRLELRAGGERISLGEGDAARIVGAEGNVVCARIERVSADAEGALRTAREAACVSTVSGRTVFRAALDAPAAFVPRRELAYRASTLAYAHTADDGSLAIATWSVPNEGGAR
jgi:hypothetical protein